MECRSNTDVLTSEGDFSIRFYAASIPRQNILDWQIHFPRYSLKENGEECERAGGGGGGD